jgi:hypothetical protein
MGIQARALDTFVYLFPFGTGEYVQRNYLSSPEIPARFEPSDRIADEFYLRAASGDKWTEVHNGYLEHVVSYGLFGAISLTVFMTVTIWNYRCAEVSADRRSLHGLAYAALAFFAVFFAFYSYPKVYVAYVFFFHVTFLARVRDGSAMVA